MKKYILLFAAALMAVFLSACGIERPDTVSYVLEAEPSRLDPAMTTPWRKAIRNYRFLRD